MNIVLSILVSIVSTILLVLANTLGGFIGVLGGYLYNVSTTNTFLPVGIGHDFVKIELKLT